jgi:hypothetical protein
MLRRFLKLSFFTALVMLVPYYIPIVIFGREGAPPNIFAIWGVGVVLITITIICIALLVAAFNYVVDGRC